jgi:hypothetical protein
MSNLLSTNKIDTGGYGYTLRLLFGAFMVLGIVALLGIFIIFPTYISIRVDRISFEERNKAIVESVNSVQNKEERNALIDARKRIEDLESVFSSNNEVMDILLAVIERRPNGANISGIQYTNKNGKETTRISGTIENRSQTQMYVAALESDRMFSTVNIPIATLADADEGIFIITAIGNSGI